MLITTPGLGAYISGAILFEETLYQKTQDGTPFVEVLIRQGIMPGIKVDKGLKEYPDFPGEKVTEGLDGLDQRVKAYAQQGAKFDKWRAEFTIYGDEKPSNVVIKENARRLKQYAGESQAEGLVPIVEPEVKIDGPHTLERCFYITRLVLDEVFNELIKGGVNLKEMILKPNIVVPGKDSGFKYSADVIAEKTVKVLKATIPQDVPGIAFLSGGLSDEDATTFLNAMNQLYGHELPWNLTFSFGRGLQREPLRVFAQKGPNYIQKAQEKLLGRAEEASLATLGKYNIS